jgi:sugar/nucleoside kinase (ribokinase family)
MSASRASDTPAVVCAGILVADLFVPPMPGLPAAGQLHATDDFLLDTGGCAANTATGLAKLDVPVRVVGTIGNDLFGDFVLRDLREKGVDTTGIRRAPDLGTSKTVVLTVTGEDRRFIHTVGANSAFRVEEIDPTLLAGARALYVGGYLVMPGVTQERLAALFRAAREQGQVTFLDVVVPAGDRERPSMEKLSGVLPYVDYFLPNDEEAAALTGERDPARQAERFLAAGCGTAVITRGGEGTLLASRSETLRADVYPVEFVDGAGSGDAFAAGFIAGVLEGWQPEETLRFASAIGASACTRLGCTTGVFTRAQADAFLRQHALEVQRA